MPLSSLICLERLNPNRPAMPLAFSTTRSSVGLSSTSMQLHSHIYPIVWRRAVGTPRRVVDLPTSTSSPCMRTVPGEKSSGSAAGGARGILGGAQAMAVPTPRSLSSQPCLRSGSTTTVIRLDTVTLSLVSVAMILRNILNNRRYTTNSCGLA